MSHAPSIGAALLLLAGAAHAQTPAPTGPAAPVAAAPVAAPVAALNDALLTAMKTGKQTSFAQRAATLAPAIEAAFDLPGILHATLGTRAAAIPADQQNALQAAFHDFTIASYTGNFDDYAGQTITIIPPPRPVGADQIVQTNITAASGHVDRIDYQMRNINGAWKAEDVLLDGSISNVAVQRSDFRALLTSGGAPALIDSLHRKTADLANGRD